MVPRVLEAMRVASEEAYGNPSSAHWARVPASEMLERGRRQIDYVPRHRCIRVRSPANH